MKQLKSFIALVVAWMTSMAAYAELGPGDTFQKESEDGSEVWYRVVAADKVTVRGGNANGQQTISIPATVTYGSQTFDVVELERGAFVNQRLLKGVNLPESITEIPVGAFLGTGVNDVSVPIILQHVKKIGRYAFKDCTDLSHLTIPEGVEVIDEGAFQDCDRLYSVEIPSTIKTIIGYPAVRPFAGCNHLKQATIKCPWLVGHDSRSSSYSDHPIWCTFGNLVRDYFLREPVTRIGAGAFRFCTNVAYIDLPNSLESIGVGAFEGLCMKLTEIKTTVEKWCEVDFDDDEWMGYPMLSAVTKFMVPADDGEYVNIVDHIQIPEGITEIKQFAFRGFQHLKEVTIPSTVTSVGKMAFAGDVSLHKVTCLATTPPAICLDSFDDIPSDAILYVPTGCLDAYEGSNWHWAFGLITEPVADGDIITVGDMAYKILSVRDHRLELHAYNGSASQVVVPEVLNYKNYDYTVVSIGDEAFKNNTTMTMLTLPGSIGNIGGNAFTGCTALTTLNSEMEYVPQLGSNAFGTDLKNNCTLYVFDKDLAAGLTSASNPDNWNAYFKAIVGPSEPIYVDLPGQLYLDGQLQTRTWSVPFLILPTGNKVQLGMGDMDVFADIDGHKDFWPTSFEVPATITYNGTTYTVTRIASRALWTDMDEITIPSTIEYIGSQAFSGALKTLFSDCTTPPATSSQAFSDFEQDPDRMLYVPKGSVEAYSEWASYFGDVQPMGGRGWEFTAQTEEGVDMKFKVTGQDENGSFTVQTYGFSNGQRTYAAIPDNYQGAITIPDSVEYDGVTYVVNAISEFSFDDDGNGIDLTEVTIPATIKTIGDWAFYSSNPTLTRVNSFAKEPPTIGTSVFNINSDPVLYVTLGSLEAYSNADSWTSSTMPIGYFYREDMRKEMTLTQSIGEGINMNFGITSKNTAMTFYKEYDNLVEDGYEKVSATIPSAVTYNGKQYTVTEIGNNTFRWSQDGYTGGYDELTSVSIPASVKTIGASAFNECKNLQSVSLSEGLETIGESAFANCKSLTSVALPKGLESIGEGAFHNCSGLNSVTGSVANIGTSAFQTCVALASVALSEGLITIGQSAFQDCSHLTSVSLPKSLRSIGDMVFIACPLTSIALPDSLRSIGMGAFSGCPLTSITLPDCLESIGMGAFMQCSSLSQVIRYTADKIPTVEFMDYEGMTITPFSMCSEDCALYVAYGCKDAYVEDSDWVQCFGDRIYDKVPVTLSSYGIGTFSSNLPLAFSDVYGITPYIVTDFSGATLTMKRQQEVPAGTGIVIYRGDNEDDFLFNSDEQEGQTDPDGSQTFYVPIVPQDDVEIATNMLVGCPEETHIQPVDGEMTNFVLAKNPNDATKLGFYKFTTDNPDGRLIPAERAYLQIPTELANSLGGVKGFSLNFGDEKPDTPTSVESIKPHGHAEADVNVNAQQPAIYNLAGQRMRKLQKGINIVNGKKIAIK